MSRRRCLKVNANKSKEMVLNKEVGLYVAEGCVRIQILGVVFWMNQVQMRQSVIGRWRVSRG